MHAFYCFNHCGEREVALFDALCSLRSRAYQSLSGISFPTWTFTTEHIH